jgi:hypothetical protein
MNVAYFTAIGQGMNSDLVSFTTTSRMTSAPVLVLKLTMAKLEALMIIRHNVSIIFFIAHCILLDSICC